MLKPRNDSQLEQRAIYLLIEEVVSGGSDFASSMPGASQHSKHGKVFQEFELPADLRHSFDKFFFCNNLRLDGIDLYDRDWSCGESGGMSKWEWTDR